MLVVDEQGIVEQKHVKAGQQSGDLRVILEGLTTKDRVITVGVQRARPGFKVNVASDPAALSVPGAPARSAAGKQK